METTQYLRTAAALLIYDRAMRAHISEKLGPEEIFECLSEDRQSYLQGLRSAGDQSAISNELSVHEFARIVDRRPEVFGFSERDRSLVRDVNDIRKRFAHPGGKSFHPKVVDRHIKLLGRLTRKIDTYAGKEAEDQDARILAMENQDGRTNESDETAQALLAEIKELRGTVEKSRSGDGTQQVESVLARLTDFEQKQADDLREALAGARENMDRSRQLLEEARQDRERARQEREKEQQLREQTEKRSRKAPPEPPQPPVRESRASSRITEDELQKYRDRFKEASSGNGWRLTTYEGEWRLTRWVGMVREEIRACVFAPSRGKETTGDHPLIKLSFENEDAAFRLLYEAEQSGEIESRAKKAIAEYESRQKPEADPAEDEVPF